MHKLKARFNIVYGMNLIQFFAKMFAVMAKVTRNLGQLIYERLDLPISKPLCAPSLLLVAFVNAVTSAP
jgi:hypothetical protein